MTKVTINLEDSVLKEMADFCSAIAMTGARPQNTLEAVGARIVFAAGKKEQEITITSLTIGLIAGNLKL